MSRAPILVPAVLAALLMTACGYAPPGQTNTAAPKYQADLEACDNSAPSDVNKRNAKSGLRWLASPVTRWTQIDDGIAACMAGKGWGRNRECTADELRQGSKNPNLTVTAAGIRCTDSAAPQNPPG